MFNLIDPIKYYIYAAILAAVAGLFFYVHILRAENASYQVQLTNYKSAYESWKTAATQCSDGNKAFIQKENQISVNEVTAIDKAKVASQKNIDTAKFIADKKPGSIVVGKSEAEKWGEAAVDSKLEEFLETDSLINSYLDKRNGVTK